MKLEAVYTWDEIRKLIETELTTNGYIIVDKIFPMGEEVIRFQVEPVEHGTILPPAPEQPPAQLPAPVTLESPPPVTKIKKPKLTTEERSAKTREAWANRRAKLARQVVENPSPDPGPALVEVSTEVEEPEVVAPSVAPFRPPKEEDLLKEINRLKSKLSQPTPVAN